MFGFSAECVQIAEGLQERVYAIPPDLGPVNRYREIAPANSRGAVFDDC